MICRLCVAAFSVAAAGASPLRGGVATVRLDQDAGRAWQSALEEEDRAAPAARRSAFRPARPAVPSVPVADLPVPVPADFAVASDSADAADSITADAIAADVTVAVDTSVDTVDAASVDAASVDAASVDAASVDAAAAAARVSSIAARVLALPPFPAKHHLESAIQKLRVVVMKERRVERSADHLAALAVEAEVEGDVLALVKKASEDCFAVLKYDIYNRKPLLGKDQPSTPAEAKSLADELIEVTNQLRHDMLSMMKTSASRVSLLAPRVQDPAPLVVAEVPLHLLMEQIPASSARLLLSDAIEALTIAQNREGRVHVAQRKSILAGLEKEADSHDVVDQAKKARDLARKAEAEVRAVPLFRRTGSEKLVQEVAERVVTEANEVTHEYMASVRSSVADIMKAFRAAQEIAKQAEKLGDAEAEQASEL